MPVKPATPAAALSTPTPILVPVGYQPSDLDFKLGENLTYKELTAISDRVGAEKGRRSLSDRDSMLLLASETHKASRARWLQDGKKWVVRIYIKE